MTGRDLIIFIKENKLEDAEIISSANEGEFQFGETIRGINGEDDLVYLCDYLQGRLSIELFHPIGSMDGELSYPTTEEALKMRGLR